MRKDLYTQLRFIKIQKYPHSIESNACVLKTFVLIFLLCEAEDEGRSINSLISF